MSRLSRPLVYNRIYGTHPLLAHAPGKVDESPWWKVLKAAVFASEDRFTSPPSLDVITWNSGSSDSIPSLRGHSLGLFERSLDHFGVRHTVLGAGLGKDWSNRMKLDLTLDFLSQSGADFVLGADSADALLIGDVGVLLERFRAQDAELVFNAEKNPWPKEAADVLRFERQIGPKPFRYLNSGVWIGRRLACLEAFRVARRWADRLESRPRSDQICWKFAYRELYPAVRADHRCELFQSMHLVGREIEVLGHRRTLFGRIR